MNIRFFLTLLLCFASLTRSQAQNPGVVVVSDPGIYTQIVAISDVHGEFEHARTLLRSARILDSGDHWAANRTLMVVVGDSIDKGPESIEVLRLWMRLQAEAAAKGGRLIVLLGNHEAEFLANPTTDSKTSATRRDAEALHIALADLANPARPLGAFLRGLPLAARVGDWVFCHSGWIPDEPWPQFVSHARSVLDSGNYGDPLLSADDSILEKKTGASGKKWWHSKKEVSELERRLDADGIAGDIFGHQPKALGITDNIGESPDRRLIKIDSGMAPVSGDAGDSSGDAASGQPYAGHLLLITSPAQLIGHGATIHIVSVASTGEKATVPLEAQ